MSTSISSLSSRFRAWLRSPAFRFALLVFIVTRIILAVWMWGVRQVFNQPLSPHEVLRPYLGVTVETRPWLEPWQRWDAIHYQAIAERGYRAYETSLFTPPLFPWLLRSLDQLTGMGSLLAGILISNLAFLISMAVLYDLAKDETGNKAIAARSVLYLASFPTAFFFMAGYTESLYLLAAMLALRLARRARWIGSGLWGAIATLVRLPGLLVVLPLGFAAWSASHPKWHWKPWLAPTLTLAGALIFPLYVWAGLDLPPWQPWFVQTTRFQGGFSLPGYSLILALRNILWGKFLFSDLFDVGFLLLFLGSMPWIVRRLPPIYGIYQGVFLLLYLGRYSDMQPLLSTARYVLALFPAFIAFSAWGQNPWINRVFLYLSWLGLLLLAGQFAIWGWVG